MVLLLWNRRTSHLDCLELCIMQWAAYVYQADTLLSEGLQFISWAATPLWRPTMTLGPSEANPLSLSISTDLNDRRNGLHSCVCSAIRNILNINESRCLYTIVQLGQAGFITWESCSSITEARTLRNSPMIAWLRYLALEKFFAP